MPLQEVGANINGSTSTDRTNYYEDVPSEYLELALWLESDRMGFLLDALDQHSFETSATWCKNERRQSYENRPYGLAGQEIRKALFPPNHPYNWQTIGSQEHLDAASLEDVKDFFRRFYAPEQRQPVDRRRHRRRRDEAAGREVLRRPAAGAARGARRSAGCRRSTTRCAWSWRTACSCSALLSAWVGPPRFDPDEAPLDVLISILGEGRSSRLLPLAGLREADRARRQRLLRGDGDRRRDPRRRDGGARREASRRSRRRCWPRSSDCSKSRRRDEEVQRAVNRLEAHYVRQLESVGGFGGRADLLNYFNVFTGDPGRLNTDFDRYSAVTPARRAARGARSTSTAGRVRLVVSPQAEVAAVDERDRPHAASPGRAGRARFQPPVPRRLKLAGGLDLLVVEKREVPTDRRAASTSRAAPCSTPTDTPGPALVDGAAADRGHEDAHQHADRGGEPTSSPRGPTSASTARTVVVSTEALTRHWPQALDLLADVIAQPDVPRERGRARAPGAPDRPAPPARRRQRHRRPRRATGCSTAARRRTGTRSAAARRRSAAMTRDELRRRSTSALFLQRPADVPGRGRHRRRRGGEAARGGVLRLARSRTAHGAASRRWPSAEPTTHLPGRQAGRGAVGDLRPAR